MQCKKQPGKEMLNFQDIFFPEESVFFKRVIYVEKALKRKLKMIQRNGKIVHALGLEEYCKNHRTTQSNIET